MNPAEYSILHSSENKHWWYIALHKLLENLVENICRESRIKKVLDIGCGSGKWGAILKSKGFDVYGIERSPLAINFSKEKGFNGLCLCSANNISFTDNSFDLITCIDIFENDTIDVDNVISECDRLLKPNGYCIALAPAFQFLFSEHDRAVHGVRRFSKNQLIKHFNKKGFHICLTKYFFTFLFPFMAFYKLMHPPRINRPRSEAHSTLFIPPFPFNSLLYSICMLESRLTSSIHMPFGTSIYIIAQKTS